MPRGTRIWHSSTATTDEPRPMTGDLGKALEAIVMVAEEPIEPELLGRLLDIPVPQVERLCSELSIGYEAAGHGFQLVRVAGGYRYQSHPDQSAYVERFVLEGQSARLSAAALETLAIVAYKQPVSRAQVAAIRGVNVDGVMRTLQQRGYIDEVGRDPGPGQAVLYGTTRAFLERLGIDRLSDLPPLAEFIPGADVVELLEQGLRSDPVEDVPSESPATGAPAAEGSVASVADDAPVDAVVDDTERADGAGG